MAPGVPVPLTYTGRIVQPDPSSDYPSLTDIALGLSRQPRFAGQTRAWWSVLDHTLFCDELVQAQVGEVPIRAPGPRLWRLAMLLHDAHEAVTADVPTDFKTVGMRSLQQELDGKIMGAYFPGGWATYAAWEHEVKMIDRRALKAEAYMVGPPMETERAERLFGQPDHMALDALALYRGMTFAEEPPYGIRGGAPLQHPAVQEYLRRVEELL